MGFAVSALLANALADESRYGIAFTGDGSFMMNPQILIDGVEHGVKGLIVIFDNRRMAAITGLQLANMRMSFAPTMLLRSTMSALRRRLMGSTPRPAAPDIKSWRRRLPRPTLMTA